MPKSVIQRMLLTPKSSAQQQRLEWEIEVDGGEIVLEAGDYHGNTVHLCNHHPGVQKIQIVCRGQVDVKDTNGIIGTHDNSVPLAIFKNATPLTLPGTRLRKLAKDLNKFMQNGDNGELHILHELSARVSDAIKYTKGKTDISTTAEMAMELGMGVCQDHAHAFIAVARSLGFSARYVSGYLLIHGEKFKMLVTHGQRYLPKV